MPILSAFFVGALFAVGLGVSGMTQPDKVIGFLDFFGAWDASLMFVMGASVVIYTVFYRVVRGYSPILTGNFHLPTRRDVDARLLGGSALFGVGWGLAGFCPGPALTSISTGASSIGIFVASMLAGMYAYTIVNRALAQSRATRAATNATSAASSA